MSTTFDILKARAGARVITWVECSGIGDMWTDGYITESNKSTLFTDAYTPTLTARNCLEPPEYSESRSIDPLTGKGNRGGFAIKLTDFKTTTYPEGYFTWLFGSERTDIGHARLAEDIDIDETTWTLSATDNTMPAGLGPTEMLAYIGLETVSYYNAPDEGENPPPDPETWQVQARSVYRSPSLWHKQNSAGVYKRVTDHPTEWRGRIVRVFLTFEAAGELAGGAAAARSSAHQIVGILERVQWDGEHWVLQCDSIDKLLDREACKGLPIARVSRKVSPAVGGFFGVDADTVTGYNSDAPVLQVLSWNDTDNAEHRYDVYVTAGTYSIEEFIEAVNAKFAAGFNARDGTAWRGELSMAYDGLELRVDYVTSAVAAEVQSCELVFNEMFGSANGGGRTDEYWGQVIVDVSRIEVGEDIPATSTAYFATVLAVSETRLTLTPGVVLNVALAQGADDSSPSEFPGGTAPAGAFGDYDRVMVESSEGKQVCAVFDVDDTNGTISLLALAPYVGPMSGTPDNPIRITGIVWLSTQGNFGQLGPLASNPLRLLLSTGLSGFNETNYDTLGDGLGIAWPHETPTAGADTSASLIDVTSFERAFADAASFCEYTEDVLYKPFRLRDWLEARLAFFGYYLAVENGQLKARQGLTVLQHEQDFAVTANETLAIAASFGQDAGIKGVRFVTGNTDIGQIEFTRTFLLGAKADLELQILELKDRAVVSDPERLQLLSQNILVEYSKEAWRYVLETDRACLDIEPGMVGSISDTGANDDSSFAGRGAPNPDGTRGLNAVRMLVLEADTDWEEGGVTRLNLLYSKVKRGGYSATAWIVSHAGAPSVLTCSANVFSPTEDGADASRFAVGDKVRVLAVNPATTENGSQAFTIDAISGNTITLSGAIDTAGANAHFATGEPLVITHNTYQTASQTATAKRWSHVGDSSNDIGDTGDAAYVW